MEAVCSSEYSLNFDHIIWRYLHVLLIVIVRLINEFNYINRYLKNLWHKNSENCFDCVYNGGYDCGLDDRGVEARVWVESRIFSFPRRQNRFWGVPNLLRNLCRGLFPWGLSGWDVKLTSHLKIVTRSRKRGSIHPLPHTPAWRSA
jgi:hypothetical protein